MTSFTNLSIKDIKKDCIFCEGSQRFIALEDSHSTVMTDMDSIPLIQWKVKARKLQSDIVCDFLVTEGFEYYGPVLHLL